MGQIREKLRAMASMMTITATSMISGDGTSWITIMNRWMSRDTEPMFPARLPQWGTTASELRVFAGRRKSCPLRVFDAFGGSATSARIIAAIGYAVNNGAKVINASFGGPDYGQASMTPLRTRIPRGYYLWPPPETRLRIMTPPLSTRPAIISPISFLWRRPIRMITLASFSNYGATSVHVAAPGENIYSTVPAARLTVWSDNFR